MGELVTGRLKYLNELKKMFCTIDVNDKKLDALNMVQDKILTILEFNYITSNYKTLEDTEIDLTGLRLNENINLPISLSSKSESYHQWLEWKIKNS